MWSDQDTQIAKWTYIHGDMTRTRTLYPNESTIADQGGIMVAKHLRQSLPIPPAILMIQK
jgi:hypothetical protein